MISKGEFVLVVSALTEEHTDFIGCSGEVTKVAEECLSRDGGTFYPRIYNVAFEDGLEEIFQEEELEVQE